MHQRSRHTLKRNAGTCRDPTVMQWDRMRLGRATSAAVSATEHRRARHCTTIVAVGSDWCLTWGGWRAGVTGSTYLGM